MIKKPNRGLDVLLKNSLNKLGIIVFLCGIAPIAYASNKGDISAAVTTWILGAVIALLVSLVFALRKNEDGRLVGLKKAKFFLLLSIFLMIVFVAGTAAFFIFM